MKKYRLLEAGERIEVGDEIHLTNWGAIHPDDDNLIGYEIDDDDVGFYRRPIHHIGDVQFLMAVSILVPVIVNCDGKAQDEIEVDAGCLAVQKILSEPTRYIHLENIDWAASKMDEIQPESKNPGKYRILQVGEQIQEGDEMKDREAFHWQYCTAYIGCVVLPNEPYEYRRPIS